MNNELPAPRQPEQGSRPAESIQPAAIEQATGGGELPHSGGTPQSSSMTSMGSPQKPVMDPTSDHGVAASSMSQNSGLQAEDTDLIEKEWVVRAKAIVANTQDNPHQQTKDMSRFKADYVKKRYNKELKVTEG